MAKFAVSTLLVAAVLVTSYAVPILTGPIVVIPDKPTDGVTVNYSASAPGPLPVDPKLIEVCPNPKTPPQIVNNVKPVSNICVTHTRILFIYFAT